MGSSWLALARERLKSIADGLGFSGRSAVLATVHAADLECFKRYAPGDFTFLAVCETVLAYAGVNTPTGINVYLYATSAGMDGEALDDLVTQLKTAWTNVTNYPGGELICAAVTFDAYESMLEEPAASLLRAHLICYFPAE
jgi:hypothetical protein